MKPYKLFASCLSGLEPLLDAELAALGIGVRNIVTGGVEFRGHASAVARVCLGSGIATRVLLRFDRFRATSFDTLRRRTAEIAWEDFLHDSEVFDVRADMEHCRLWHSNAVEERIALGILDRLGNAASMAERASEESDVEDEAHLVLRVRGSGDRFGIAIDLSGAPLWRRGWRLESGKAPLREDLAHALVALSGYDGSCVFADPFCGSGTLGIEAACRRRGLAPGRLRRFAFERTKLAGFAKKAEILAAWNTDATAPAHRILLSDRDAGAIEAARNNARRAGVEDDLTTAVCAVSEAEVFGLDERVALVTNPPYGHRIGGTDLRALYQRFGTLVRGLQAGSSLSLVTAEPRLARAIGLELESLLSTEHGGTRVRFLRGLVSASPA